MCAREPVMWMDVGDFVQFVAINVEWGFGIYPKLDSLIAFQLENLVVL